MRCGFLFPPLIIIFPLLPLSTFSGEPKATASAQEPAKKESEGLIAVNTSGKELTFKKWKVVQGTRFIVGQTPKVKAPAKDKDKEGQPAPTPAKQEYLEFREDNSTTYQEGILTLIPFSSVRKMEYTNEEKTKTEAAKRFVAVTFVADGKEIVLSGTTKYDRINKLIIDGQVDVGDMGPSTVRLPGGMFNAKTVIIKSFRFPFSQSVAKPTGPFSVIDGVDKDKTKHKVQDLQALYRVKGEKEDRISSAMMFKKDAKIDVATVVKLRKAPPEKKKEPTMEWEVTLTDGKQLNLLLVKDVFPDTGAPAQFLGLIGKVAAGYKLFPLHTLSEMRKEE